MTEFTFLKYHSNCYVENRLVLGVGKGRITELSLVRDGGILDQIDSRSCDKWSYSGIFSRQPPQNFQVH